MKGVCSFKGYIKSLCSPLFLIACLRVAADGQAQSLDSLPVVPETSLESLENTEQIGAAWVAEGEEQAAALQGRINLNNATRETMEASGLWTPQQVQAFLEHRLLHGPMQSLYELQSIAAFDLPCLRRTAGHITLGSGEPGSRLPWYRMAFGGQHQVLMRTSATVERQQAYAKDDSLSPYAGNRQRLFLRYAYRFGQRLRYGLSAEKDAGERYFGQAGDRGPDHLSAYFHVRDLGRWQDLALGDFEFRFGQGLVWWSGFGLRKGAAVMDIAKTGRPIRPYTSLDENRFLRGAALRYGHDRWDLSAFASHKKADASDGPSDELSGASSGSSSGEFRDSLDAVGSLVLDGLHRTESERAKKDRLGETTLGIAWQWHGKRGDLGILVSHLEYDRALSPPQRPDNSPAFRGKRRSHAAFHYRQAWGSAHFFGEVAITDAGALATVHGVQLSLHPQFDLALVGRSYSPAYYAPFGQGFGEQSTMRNEQGIYAGLWWRPAQAWEVSLYADQYRHPWLRFQADAPSYGRDLMANVVWTPKRHAAISLRLRWETKEQNRPGDSGPLDQLAPTHHAGLRLHARLPLGKDWRWQSRVEWVRHAAEGQASSIGFLAYQDLRWAPLGSRWRWSARYLVFDAPSFDARVYAYENDVLYAFSMPFFYGRGHRWYLVGRYRITRHADIYVRFAQTGYTDRDKIGYGPEAIQGNTKSEWKLSLRWQIGQAGG